MSIIVRSLPDQTYEILRERILRGALAPGTPVRQDIVAAGLGISKIPLREALSRLEQDGLLSSQPNRGYVVRPLTTDEAGEVFALRLKLEPGAAAEACRLADSDDRQLAMAELAALEAEEEQSQRESVTLNRGFHLALLRPGGPISYQLLEKLHLLSERYVRVHLEPLGRRDRARDEHRDLLAAWMGADGARVEALMTAHIAQTLADLREQLPG
jgi:DNA-binding GntR family transcriptional regulator